MRPTAMGGPGLRALRRGRRMLGLMLIGGGWGRGRLWAGEKGTLYGGGGGAATGAIIGGFTGNPGLGAAMGGGLGAVGGAVVGNQMQNNERQQGETQSQI